MAQYARSAVVTVDDVPNHEIQVMHLPANTCHHCFHMDCIRRRAVLNVPCAVCEAKVRPGQRYRVLSKVDGEVASLVHADCEIEMVARERPGA